MTTVTSLMLISFDAPSGASLAPSSGRWACVGARATRPSMAKRWECLLIRGTASPSHRRPAPRSLHGMENRNEIREFLASRRARITPGQAGLPAYGGHRRVPGLRREKVALLAGQRLPVNLARFLFLDPRRRRPRADLRGPGTARRSRPDHHHLHRRARLHLPGGAGLPRQLGGEPGPARPASDGPDARRRLAPTGPRPGRSITRSEMELLSKQPSVKPAERFTGDVW